MWRAFGHPVAIALGLGISEAGNHPLIPASLHHTLLLHTILLTSSSVSIAVKACLLMRSSICSRQHGTNRHGTPTTHTRISTVLSCLGELRKRHACHKVTLVVNFKLAIRTKGCCGEAELQSFRKPAREQAGETSEPGAAILVGRRASDGIQGQVFRPTTRSTL